MAQKKRSKVEPIQVRPVPEMARSPAMPVPMASPPDTGSRLIAAIRAAPLAIMGIATVANLAAFWLGRLYPNMGVDPIALLLPLAGLVLCWPNGDRSLPREAAWWLLGLIAFLTVYLVTDLSQPELPPVAWGHFGGRCLLVCSAALVLLAPISCAAALRLGAIGGGMAAIAFAAPDAWALVAGRITEFEQMQTGGMLFGNVSWLVNLAAPGILAWMTWRAVEGSGRGRPWVVPILAIGVVLIAVAMIQSRGLEVTLIPVPAAIALLALVVAIAGWSWSCRGVARFAELALPLGGFAALALVGIASGRRGFAVALALMLAVVAFDRLRSWRPRLAFSLAAVGLVGLAGLFTYAFILTDGHRHGDRFILYRAALESAGHSFPWGQGGYASLDFHGHAPDYGAYMTAWMKMCDHVHNEFLEVLLHVGLPGLLLACGLLAAAAWWSFRIVDTRLRLGCQVLCVAVLVPACTDNSLATTAGSVVAGASLGLLVKAAAENGEPVSRWPRAPAGLLWSLRLLLVPVAVTCAWMAWRTLPVLELDRQRTTTNDIARAIASSKDIYAVKTLANLGMSATAQARSAQAGRQIIFAVREALGEVPWGLEPFNFALDLGDRAGIAEACIGCLTHYPFEDRFYDELERARIREPLVEGNIPDPIRRRLDVLYHPERGARIDISRAPLTVADAADQYIALRALYGRGGDWSQVVPSIERLLERYRLIPNLTKLALEAVVYAPADAAEGIGARMAALPLVAPAPHAMAAFLDATASTPEIARRMPPLLEKLFPVEYAKGRQLAEDTASSPDQAGGLPTMIARVLRLAESAPQNPAR